MTTDDRAAVLACFQDQAAAMVTGDTRALSGLLGDDFTLTHITGYVQPQVDWLAEMRAGRFDYHQIEGQDLTVDVDGDTAVLRARTITDATVYGTREDWHLVLTQTYERADDGTWIATRSVATTW